MSREFYYVVNMLNLRLAAPLVEMSFKYTIPDFTIPKKLIFPRGEGDFHVNFVDKVALWVWVIENESTWNHFRTTQTNRFETKCMKKTFKVYLQVEQNKQFFWIRISLKEKKRVYVWILLKLWQSWLQAQLSWSFYLC